MARAADSPIAAAIGRHDTTARRPAAIVSIHPTWLIETKDSPCRVFPFQPFPFFSTFFSLKFLSSGLIPLFFLSLRNHRLIAIFLQFMIHFDKMFFFCLCLPCIKVLINCSSFPSCCTSPTFYQTFHWFKNIFHAFTRGKDLDKVVFFSRNHNSMHLWIINLFACSFVRSDFLEL